MKPEKKRRSKPRTQHMAGGVAKRPTTASELREGFAPLLPWLGAESAKPNTQQQSIAEQCDNARKQHARKQAIGIVAESPERSEDLQRIARARRASPKKPRREYPEEVKLTREQWADYIRIFGPKLPKKRPALISLIY